MKKALVSDIGGNLMSQAAAQFREHAQHIKPVLAPGLGSAARRALDTPERWRLFQARQAAHFPNATKGLIAPAEVVDARSHDPDASEDNPERSVTAAPSAALALSPDGLGFERSIGPHNNLLSIEFFEAGLEASKAVGRVELAGGLETGTGFLVAPGVILTNHHVLPDPTKARVAELVLMAESNRLGVRKASIPLFLNPGKLYCADPDLDFAFVAVDVRDNDQEEVDACGWLPLFEEEGKILNGHPVNIIQHPNGGEKMVAVHDSRFTVLSEPVGASAYCWYTADTDEGSSGSPVFNTRWEVVGLHQKAIPKTDENGHVLDVNNAVLSVEHYQLKPDLVQWEANRGIRVSRIVRSFRQLQPATPSTSKLHGDLLALWARPEARRPGLKRGWYGVR